MEFSTLVASLPVGLMTVTLIAYIYKIDKRVVAIEAQLKLIIQMINKIGQ